MKKIIGFLFSAVLFAGCGKVETYSNDFASAAFINATPFVNPPTGTPATSMRVFIDGLQKTSSNVVFTGSTSPAYLSVVPGTRSIEVRSSLDTSIKFAVSSAENFVTNTASSFFVYDTVDNATGRARLLRLKDDLTVPPTGFIKIRYVPLAVNAPAMDVTIVRNALGISPADSITFSNQTYVGPAPSQATLDALSQFRTLALGVYQFPSETFSVRLKAAGTQTLLAAPQGLALANLTGTGSVTGIVTIFVTGTAKGQPLRVGLFRHYP